MDKQRYMISDAATVVNVESHVLRYWEDELELTIPRNEMGHRYYTKENIEQFQRIKELKEQGYQLKAIRMLIHNASNVEGVKQREPESVEKTIGKLQSEYSYQLQKMTPANQSLEAVTTLNNTDKLEQFQNMMTQIVKQAIEENNRALGKEVGSQVGEKVIKEMNYLMREQDEQEEERYRKLDEAIRNYSHSHTKKEKDGKLFHKHPELKPNQV